MVSRKAKLYGVAFVYAMLSVFTVSLASGADGDDQASGGIFDNGQTAVEPAANDIQIPKGQSVKVGSFGQIDLHVKDLDLTRVLQLLSIQSQRNIIASRNVAGTVSAEIRPGKRSALKSSRAAEDRAPSWRKWFEKYRPKCSQ